jgi:hypothetical protein
MVLVFPFSFLYIFQAPSQDQHGDQQLRLMHDKPGQSNKYLCDLQKRYTWADTPCFYALVEMFPWLELVILAFGVGKVDDPSNPTQYRTERLFCSKSLYRKKDITEVPALTIVLEQFSQLHFNPLQGVFASCYRAYL